MPQCGFSRAAVQILELHGIQSEKLKSFDVLQDSSLRNDIKEFSCVSLFLPLLWAYPCVANGRQFHKFT